MRIGLQGRKPGESNKLFDLFYRHRTLSVLSVRSVVKEEKAIRGKNKKPSSGVLLSGQNIQCFILPIVLLLLPYRQN